MTTDEDWRAPGTPAVPSPVLSAAIAQVSSALDALLAIAPASLGDEDVARLLGFATSCVDRAAGAVTAAVGEADHRRLGDGIGARHTGQWWARRSLLTRPEANRLTRLGRHLCEEAYAPVQAALAGGELHADQAAVIIAAVEAIASSPEELPSDAEAPAVLRARARDHLLVLAQDHDAQQLTRLGRRILDLVAPAVGEAAEAKALAAEEAAAARRVSLTLLEHTNGTTTGRFTLPTAAAEMFRKQLLAIAAPKHRATTQDASETRDPEQTPDRDERPWAARLGSAFIEWIEAYPADHLPSAGGVSATVVVTMPLASLMGGLAAASLDTGARISAGEARRLACEAGIIPAVLGGKSEVLDLGRTRRFHTRAQRLAIAHRDRGCTAQGCHLPPAACHVHHDQPWSTGGPTNVETARLLCHRHHRVIHDDRYQTTRHPNRTVSFHRRT